jgi:hypothetical protein
VTVCAAAFTGSTAHMVGIRGQHTADEPGVRLVGLPAEHAWLTRDLSTPPSTVVSAADLPVTAGILGPAVYAVTSLADLVAGDMPGDLDLAEPIALDAIPAAGQVQW